MFSDTKSQILLNENCRATLELSGFDHIEMSSAGFLGVEGGHFYIAATTAKRKSKKSMKSADK